MLRGDVACCCVVESQMRFAHACFAISALRTISADSLFCAFSNIGLGGFLVILALLEIPLETVRILALKMLGLLLCNNPKNAAQFRRVNGFEQLFNLLSRFPPTYTTCSTLLSIAIDAFRY